jgi:hypothetical protein
VNELWGKWGVKAANKDQDMYHLLNEKSGIDKNRLIAGRTKKRVGRSVRDQSSQQAVDHLFPHIS